MRIDAETASATGVHNVVADAAVNERAAEANAALREGIKAAQAGERDKARNALLRAADLDPRSEAAWLWLASISDYPEELVVFLNNVLEINPDNSRANEWMAATKALLARTFVQRGIDAMDSGQKDLAAQYFGQALEQDQKNTNAWLWLANLSDSNEGRISYLEKVLEIEPDHEAAQAAYDRARNEINQAMLAEARSAAVAGQKEEAMSLLEAFLAENPETEEGWFLKAHLADGFAEKIAAFDRVLSINPENVAARSGLDSLQAIMQMASPAPAHTETAVEMVEEAVSEPETEPDAAFEYEAATEETEVEETDEVKDEAFAEEATDEPDPIDLATTDERSEAPGFMENTAYALLQERALESEAVQDKSPTEELEFPAAAAEFAESQAAMVEEPAEDFEEDPLSETASSFEPVQEPQDIHSTQPDWAVDTVAFTFSFPAGVEQQSEPETVPQAADHESFEFAVPPVEIAEDVPASAPLMTVFDDALEYRPEPEVIEAAVIEEQVEAMAYEAMPEFAAAESAGYEASIPMPESFDAEPSERLTGFETYIVRDEEEADEIPVVDAPMPTEEPAATVAEPMNVEAAQASVDAEPEGYACSFCGVENPHRAFQCSNCLATLSLIDLDMMLSNTRADAGVLRNAIEVLEAKHAAGPLSGDELTVLGIGHLNLRNFEAGYDFLLEAAHVDPANAALAGQIHALRNRLDEMKGSETETTGPEARLKTILVVDDSATVRKLIAGKLEKSGHAVYCAADGVEALEQLESVTPDLILLDITMPRMDGYQVCKVIRSKDATKNVPVVMISGKDGFFDKVRGRMAGTTGYITKPFGPETLMKAVDTYLSGEQVQ